MRRNAAMYRASNREAGSASRGAPMLRQGDIPRNRPPLACPHAWPGGSRPNLDRARPSRAILPLPTKPGRLIELPCLSGLPPPVGRRLPNGTIVAAPDAASVVVINLAMFGPAEQA